MAYHVTRMVKVASYGKQKGKWQYQEHLGIWFEYILLI